MTKFNPKSTHRSVEIDRRLRTDPTATVNYEGGLAFTLSDKAELFTRVATSLVGEPKYYTTGSEADAAMMDAIHRVLQTDPEFILKLAAYCRNELYLRSVPMVLLTEFANGSIDHMHPSEVVPSSRRYVPKIVRRADEIPELLALQLARNTKYPRQHGKIPMLIKNGLRDAFCTFDEYQFQKYRSDGKAVTMRDAMFMVHPRGKTAEQQRVFDRLANDTIGSASTWETKLMTGGASRASWESAIPTMGYMAVLRNLRNFLKYGVNLNLVEPILTDPERIAHSKQFPFRFYSASRAVAEIPMDEIANPYDQSRMLKMLAYATNQSVVNVPRMLGKTVVAVDVSGSMDAVISKNSAVTRKEISALFGAMVAQVSTDCIVVPFATGFKTTLMRSNDILTNMAAILSEPGLGYGTNAYQVFDYFLRRQVPVDRFILLSDMQCYNSRGTDSVARTFMDYQRRVNPKVYLYSIDLAGYGTAQVPEHTSRTVLLAGWNEKVLNFIELFERDAATMVGEIDRYDQKLFGPTV